MIIVPGAGVGLVGDGGNNEVATFTDERHVQGEANLTFDGSTLTVTGALTVGVDDTGHDVTFFGATAGKKMLWDESANSLKFPDSTYLYMGTGDDLVLFHDGSNSYVRDVGTGNLILSSNAAAVEIQTHGGASMAKFTNSGASELYHNGTVRLTTNASGLEINGSLEVATIDFTDGDLAMTIADGGGVTFAQDATFDGDILLQDSQKLRPEGSNPAKADNYLWWKNSDGIFHINVGADGAVLNLDSNGNGSSEYFKVYKDGTDAGGTLIYTLDAAGDVTLTGSLEVATIDFTDGDLAMTISDGGAVEFAQNMTVPNIEVGDGGYIRFGGDYPMIDDNGYLQFITATNADFWWTHGSQNVMQLDTSAYQLHLGAGVAADTALIFDGNAVDYHIGLDDTEDSLNIGYDTTLSDTTSIFQFYKTATKYTVARFNPYFTSDGSSSVVTGLNVAPVLVGASGDTTYQTWLDMSYGGITTQAVSETIGNISTLRISEPNITIGSGSSVTSASSLYIAGAPTEATNNYALWVDSGVSRFDGQVLVGTSATGFNTAYDDLIVGSGSGDTGMFIYSGSSDIGGLMFHDAANTSLSGFITYDHNINYLYFGTQGLGRISMYGGTSPVLRIGIGQEYDTTLLFDGHQLDVYMAVDDSGDNFKIGTGTTVGSNAMLQMDASNTYSYNDFKPAADSTYSLGSSSYGWSTLYLSDTGASNDEGPTIQMYTKSASPADNDQLASVLWYGRNDADQNTIYGKIRVRTVDVSDGTEDGRMDFYTTVNGSTSTIGMYLNQHGDLNIVRNLQMNQAATAQDSMLWWDGNAQDYYIALDDSADTLVFGNGSTVGSSASFYINSSAEAVYVDNLVMTDSKFLKWGNAPDYAMYYDAANTRWAFGSFDGDGSGTDLDLIRINDGQTTIDANTTFDANAFDIYDDAMLLASSISPTADAYDFGKGVFKRGREALVEVGILKEYEDGWIGYNDQRMAALLAGGIYQTRQLVDEMKEEINKLRKQVTALGG